MEIPEISKLKLEFNNDVMKTKKFILQAKIQTIHKLSKKSKQLKTRKGSDEDKAKFASKAEAIVSEIYTIKKIKHDELGRFAMENFDKLAKLMNTPVITKEKAMAKLLSHKCLKPKFEKIIEKFSCVPVVRLLEVDPRKMRRKQRKEKLRLLEKSAPKITDKNNADSSEVHMSSLKSESEEDQKLQLSSKPKKQLKSRKEKDIENEDYELSSNSSNSENEMSDNQHNLENSESENAEGETIDVDESNYENEKESEVENEEESDVESEESDIENEEESDVENGEESEDEITFYPPKLTNDEKSSKKTKNKTKPDQLIIKPPIKTPEASTLPTNDASTKPKRKGKRMMVDLNDDEIDLINTEKTVDSFFVTDTGDNYMTVALPRPPDIKPGTVVDEYAANRRSRRAAMFGNEVPKPRKPLKNPKQNNFMSKTSNQQYDSRKSEGKHFDIKNKGESFNKFNNNKFDKTKSPSFQSKAEEKLHPSWEAKKKKMGIVAFAGKKVTFD